MSGKPLFLLKRPLWLASSSRYRRELLARLGLPFECLSPNLDETRREGEPPAELATRLALAKALAVAESQPQAIVIGSDQVCALGDDGLGKPGSRSAQIAMLERLSGQVVVFHTAVAIVNVATALTRTHLDQTRCVFRKLDRTEIETYVEREPAYDCAGGFKSEGLGLTLLDRMETVDPTALIGLPLIAVATILRDWDA